MASLCLTEEFQGHQSWLRPLKIRAHPVCQSKLCVVSLLTLVTVIVKITGNTVRFVKYDLLVGFEVWVLSTSVWKLQSTS